MRAGVPLACETAIMHERRLGPADGCTHAPVTPCPRPVAPTAPTAIPARPKLRRRSVPAHRCDLACKRPVLC